MSCQEDNTWTRLLVVTRMKEVSVTMVSVTAVCVTGAVSHRHCVSTQQDNVTAPYSQKKDVHFNTSKSVVV